MNESETITVTPAMRVHNALMGWGTVHRIIDDVTLVVLWDCNTAKAQEKRGRPAVDIPNTCHVLAIHSINPDT